MKCSLPLPKLCLRQAPPLLPAISRAKCKLLPSQCLFCRQDLPASEGCIGTFLPQPSRCEPFPYGHCFLKSLQLYSMSHTIAVGNRILLNPTYWDQLLVLALECWAKGEVDNEAMQVKKWGFAGLLNAKARETVPDTPEALPSKNLSETEQPEEVRPQSGAAFGDAGGAGLQNAILDSCLPLQKSKGRGHIEILKDKLLTTLKTQACSKSGELTGVLKSCLRAHAYLS